MVSFFYFLLFFFLISKRIIPTIIEIRLNISLKIAPIEPVKQLYVSQRGELIRPKRLTILETPIFIAIVATIIAITGKISIIKLNLVGGVLKTKKLRG